MTLETIRSAQNQKFKDLQKLRDRKGRRQQQSFLVEGLREINIAFEHGYKLLEIWSCPELVAKSPEALTLESRLIAAHGLSARRIQITSPLFKKLAVREQAGGILCRFELREHSVDELFEVESPLIVVLDRVEKPGNLGAIFRTASSAGVTGIILLGESLDIYNPNVIRASLGSCFSLPSAALSQEELIASKNNSKLLWTALTPFASQSLYESQLTRPRLLVFGSEAFGIDPELEACCDERILIPMQGSTDSLNLSVSVGVVVYESLRQNLSAT